MGKIMFLGNDGVCSGLGSQTFICCEWPRLMFKGIVLFLLVTISAFGSGLEERVEALERKISNLQALVSQPALTGYVPKGVPIYRSITDESQCDSIRLAKGGPIYVFNDENGNLKTELRNISVLKTFKCQSGEYTLLNISINTTGVATFLFSSKDVIIPPRENLP